MTQKQIQELFCVAPSTLKEWKNNADNKKHNLGIFLSSLDYESTKKEIDVLKKST